MLNHTFLSVMFEKELKRFGNKIQYRKFDPTASPKNKYGESKRKTYATSIEFDAIVKFEPSSEELEEYGMDKDKVRVVAKVLTVQLEFANVKVSTDDILEINGEKYFVASLGGAGRVAEKPIFVVIGCAKESENRGT